MSSSSTPPSWFHRASWKWNKHPGKTFILADKAETRHPLRSLDSISLSSEISCEIWILVVVVVMKVIPQTTGVEGSACDMEISPGRATTRKGRDGGIVLKHVVM
nr:hypothetical protein Iba_chr15cCG5070 [Ipomoea batatas]